MVLFHLLGFILTLIFLTAFTIFQVFVTPTYQRLPLKYYLSPSHFITAIKNLKYQPDNLGAPQLESEFLNKTINVSCQPTCQFNLIKPQSLKIDKSIPALVEGDPLARLKALKLHFYDQTRGLIGYQSLSESPVFYVIDQEGNLLQVIQLKLNSDINLTFKAYYEATKQILFHSQSQDFLYVADQPWLTLQNPDQATSGN